MELKRGLSYFDLMNIVIGAIVGSDIYIIPGLTAGLIGPFAIVEWIIGGAMAMVLAIVFGYCAYYVPNVGGSYAYAAKAFNKFYGFIAGWSMCVAEIVALPVFAIVFTNYLQYFIPLSGAAQLLVRTLFVIVFVAVNIVGVKAAGRINDVLTIAKLAPLLMIIVVGIGSILLNPRLAGNYSPFAPMGLGNFGPAMVLIFWAYAGFELGSLPASEVVDPKKNIPKALISGMAIVIFFYVFTNVAVFGVVSTPALKASAVPLLLVGTALLGTAGAVVTGFGALASVSGTDETEVLGTARLMYAMSADGLLPKAIHRVHPRFQTPYVAVLIEGAIALALSLYTGITQLISFAVFNLAICYLLVCLSLWVLKKDEEHGLRGQRILPWLGAIVSLYLIFSTSLTDIIIGSVIVLLGIPVYLFFSKTTVREVEDAFLSDEQILRSNLEKRNVFLANLVRLVRKAFGRKSST
ncbi:MAG TPA: amino acid permease [Nitrososphaerales archaeon]|nr:amino acid permease [Nitrososphaerales archaeon]